MLEGNLLIRASAGTGKTYALATRYLRLMLLDEVKPEKIVALTFSRAAAQEIYTKILERLWKAAASEDGAKEESAKIREGLEDRNAPQTASIPESWDKATFASLLRRLLDTQHLGTIATLDSFILRMVRNFPLEMGFQHAVEVLDAAGEGDAIRDALQCLCGRARWQSAARSRVHDCGNVEDMAHILRTPSGLQELDGRVHAGVARHSRKERMPGFVGSAVLPDSEEKCGFV